MVGHNSWDQRYSQPGYSYGVDPNDFLAETASLIRKNGRVLTLAEGEGRNAVFLAKKGLRVLAIDASSVGLAKARELAAQRGVRLETQCEDLNSFKIEDESFDGITSIWCHLPPELRIRVHQDCVRGLKSGGIFLLEAYTPRQLEFGTGGPHSPELLMTADQLRKELHGLELLRLEEKVREVFEGRYHTGPSHVVQVVARKL